MNQAFVANMMPAQPLNQVVDPAFVPSPHQQEGSSAVDEGESGTSNVASPALIDFLFETAGAISMPPPSSGTLEWSIEEHQPTSEQTGDEALGLATSLVAAGIGCVQGRSGNSGARERKATLRLP
jgi:hypothetical protein